MTDLAVWGPTIVSGVIALLAIGGYVAVIKDHGKRLDDHDELHKETEKHDALQDVSIAKLEAFNSGFSTARAIYDKHQVA